jgi:hypothetical protein
LQTATSVPASVQLTGSITLATVVRESGIVVWKDMKFNPGAVVGVNAASVGEGGRMLKIECESGAYSFSLE